MHGTRPIEKRAPFFPKQSERFDGKARNFLAAAPYVGGDKAVFDRTNWASVRATWQGARAGEGINPKITARWAKSYEKLLGAAQPTTDIFRLEYSAPYHRRWLKATTAYLDLRRQGKVRNKQDATGGIAAAETAFNAFYDHLRAYRGLMNSIYERSASVNNTGADHEREFLTKAINSAIARARLTVNSLEGKMSINPMHKAHAASRCTAKSKRTGKPCRSPAVRGRRVCRMHGARGGAPEGKRNGNYRHGVRSKEIIELWKLIKSLR